MESSSTRASQSASQNGVTNATRAFVHDRERTKEQLLDELTALRQRVGSLEALVVERKAIETDLEQARQRLQHLLAVSPAIIYTTHASGDYACTFVSENLFAIMGHAPEEMITDAKCWPDRLHPDDVSRVFNEMFPLIEQGGGTIEYRFRHQAGHYLWIQDTFKVVRDETGRPLELVGAWADISARKRAEQVSLEANEELHETKRYLTRLIESSPDAIIATDRDGNIVLFNEGAESLLGYSGKEVVGRRAATLYGGEAGANEVVREMRKRGGSVSGHESALVAKDGSRIPVLVSASVLVDEENHEVGTVAFTTDLRERKKGEEALQRIRDELETRIEERTAELRTARERQRYLLTVTPGVIYTNQASGNYACTFVSENVESIMGFSTWEMLEDPEFWSKRLHPEDVSRVFHEMPPLIERGGGAIEYRFRHLDGHYVWIQDTFKVVHDESGRPSEIVGSWADISDRKRVEQALGERMALMNDLQNLVAASPAVIYTTQATGAFACTFVSENLTSTMGYAPWEMREDPKFWAKRLHPEDAARVFHDMGPMIEQGGGALEYRFRHRQGRFIWIQDTFTVIRDQEGKPKELIGSWADISDRKRIESQLQHVAEQLEVRNRFIRETFGRYLTDEVVATLLESPGRLQIGGEKRKVTMMMADLRGFTSLSERLAPERVVRMLNRYLATMVKIVKRYDGTIDEFIGDAIFVLFGAPVWREDDAQRAVACAIAMQLAIPEINQQNREDDLPEIEMGIGIHTGQVVLGNIGSPDRMKYGVVGRHVNLTSRIQTYATGGQILLSESTRHEVGRAVRIGKQFEVRAKGIEHAVTVCEALGIGRPHKLSLPDTAETLVPLTTAIPMRYTIAEAGEGDARVLEGSLTKLATREAEARLGGAAAISSNLSIHVLDAHGNEVPGVLYARVSRAESGNSMNVSITFMSMSPEIRSFLRDQRQDSSTPV